MGHRLGIGNIDLRNIRSAFNWEAYWASHYPSALTLTVDSDTQITLDWTNNGDADYDGVSIERSTDGITYAEIDTGTAGDVQYVDATCAANTQYYYRVRYYRGTHYSAYCDPANKTTYQAELGTYISGLVTPLSAGQLTLLNTLITSIKTGMIINNLTDVFDTIYILAGETAESSLRNLVKNTHYATAVNAPAFTALEGFLTDGLASYIDTNYNPLTQAVRYTLNSASFGVYSRTDRGSALGKAHGAITGSAFIRIYPLRIVLESRVQINNLTNIPIVNDNTLGMISVIRMGVNSAFGAKNKTMSAEEVTASIEIPAVGNLYLGCLNPLGSYDDIQLSFAYTARGINQAELNVLFDAVEAYMDANGKGVVV